MKFRTSGHVSGVHTRLSAFGSTTGYLYPRISDAQSVETTTRLSSIVRWPVIEFVRRIMWRFV